MPTDDSDRLNSNLPLASHQLQKHTGLLKQVFSVLILLLIIGI